MKIWELFTGYEKSHGSFDVRRTNERGKAEGRALTLPGPASPELWELHLSGKAGLGVIPLLEDNTLWWACLDVDVYNVDHAELERKIEIIKAPLVITRSKSGGAHCFIFFSEPASAKDVRRRMEHWAAALGYGSCEIFPKQIERYDATVVGNWLNMPYFWAEKTTRYGIRNGQSLTLEEFEDYATSRRVVFDDLQLPGGGETLNGAFQDGPPCLQMLQQLGGFAKGTMKDGMFNVAIYLRKRFPDDWEEKLIEYNNIMCNPPLKPEEVTSIAKQVNKKNYSFKCKLAPINAHCQRSICQGRTFGVGENVETNYPRIGTLVKYESEPVIWYLDVDGHQIQFTTRELTTHRLFREKVADKITAWSGSIPMARWDKFIGDLMAKCEVAKAPEEASPFGQFKILVNQYLVGMAQATSKEELAHRLTPFRTGTGVVWFRSRGILEYLKTHSFNYRSEHHVWQMLREMGAKHDFIMIGKNGFNIWILPDPDNPGPDAPLPEFGTKEF